MRYAVLFVLLLGCAAPADNAMELREPPAGGSSGWHGGDASASDAAASSDTGRVMLPQTMSDAPVATSGSRLKLVQARATDGAMLPPSWWDSEREEGCAFSDALGDMRCLPAAVSLPFFYSDYFCSKPIVVLDCGNELRARYVWRTESANACGMITQRLLEIGGAWDGPVYERTLDSCALRSPSGCPDEQPDCTVHELVEVHASDFVGIDAEATP